MGIHIFACKHNGITTYQDDFGKERYDNAERIDTWFDSIRMGGDKEFMNDVDWEYLESVEGRLYRRPKDIDLAIQYCLGTDYQKRFIPFLEAMKTDSSLCFYVSY